MTRRFWPALAALAALAAGLRLWGSLQAPLTRHPDEIFMVVFPLEFFSGDLNPHRFYYPTLHFYLLGLVYWLCFAAQKIFGGGWSRVEFAAGLLAVGVVQVRQGALACWSLGAAWGRCGYCIARRCTITDGRACWSAWRRAPSIPVRCWAARCWPRTGWPGRRRR